MDLIKCYNKFNINTGKYIKKGLFACPKCKKKYNFRFNHGLKKKLCHYCTESYGKKLTKKDVTNIREEYNKGNISLRKLGKKYNVSHNMVWLIVKHKTWNF